LIFMDIFKNLTGLIFLAAAILEVGGDALIRKGLGSSNFILIIAGFFTLGCYGLMVNLIKWDFSRLLGVYVAVFALISVLWGLLVFKETISNTTWIGLAVIIQSGQK
jgi:drug/metabolite transporter superfamily protein YnfA